MKMTLTKFGGHGAGQPAGGRPENEMGKKGPKKKPARGPQRLGRRRGRPGAPKKARKSLKNRQPRDRRGAGGPRVAQKLAIARAQGVPSPAFRAKTGAAT